MCGTSALSASANRAMTSPVAGLIVAKVLPETASTHSLLISNFVGPEQIIQNSGIILLNFLVPSVSYVYFVEINFTVR
jgi:hypothetical protein